VTSSWHSYPHRSVYSHLTDNSGNRINFVNLAQKSSNCISTFQSLITKEATTSREAEIIYSKIPKSAVIRELKEEGAEEWHSEWDAPTKGPITKSFFSTVGDRLSHRLQMNIKQSTTVTGHGTLRSYYHRFKIIDDPKCVCKKGTTDLRSPTVGMRAIQKTKRSSRKQNKEGRWKLTHN